MGVLSGKWKERSRLCLSRLRGELGWASSLLSTLVSIEKVVPLDLSRGLTVDTSPQGYDNSESSVRKACVFCLVAVHAVIGEELKPHLSQLTGSKVSPCCFVIKTVTTA